MKLIIGCFALVLVLVAGSVINGIQITGPTHPWAAAVPYLIGAVGIGVATILACIVHDFKVISTAILESKNNDRHP